nr:integrator complex subunit 12-like [Crassostrea gigas]
MFVCKSFDVKTGNQLVECQECHHLYHQECHKPPVTEQDVHDPRFVWYCYKCTKSLKKLVNKPSKNKSDDAKEKVRPSSSKSSSSSNKNDPAGLFNFRKVSTSSNNSNNSGANLEWSR